MILARSLKGNARRTRKALRKFGVELDLEFDTTRRPWSYYSGGTAYINVHCVDNPDIYFHEAGHWFIDSFYVVERKDFAKRFGTEIWYPRYAYRWICHAAGRNSRFDPEKHITTYASVSAEEDFCECFEAVLNGEDPDDYTRTIRSKLKYVIKRLEAEGR